MAMGVNKEDTSDYKLDENTCRIKFNMELN